MDVYRQAADVVRKVREGSGTAKALCLEKQMQKKKQTFAVACETLRRYDGIVKILERAQFFEYYPHVDKELAMVLTFDTCFGLGVKTRQHVAAIAIADSAQYLQEALQSVAREDPSILERAGPKEELDEGEEGKGGATAGDLSARLPTYVRVNTLVEGVTVEGTLEYFKKRDRAQQDDDPNFVPTVKRDAHVPHLLVLPPRTDLHKAKLMRNGSIIVQDKASCIPAAVLFGAVPVTKPEGSQVGPPMRRIVDACSAPGNKTTQAAALGVEANGADGIKVVAVEMDQRRAAILRDRVKFLHGDEIITVEEGDFMELSNKHRSRAEGVLVDPSCSASGMVKRVDVTATSASSGDTEKRVENLARMQEKLLTSALTCFPRARRVVYSTCSIHERENEEVVRRVLAADGVAAQWALANIMPDTWATRGFKSTAAAAPTTSAAAADDDEEAEGAGAETAAAALPPPPTEFCVRCDPAVDRTSGFFVACFDRIADSPPL